MEESAARALRAGADALEVPLTASDEARLLAFLNELARWNRAYNLVAAADAETWMTRHLLDSLSIAPHVRAHLLPSSASRASGETTTPRVLDLGSGAGLPGLPLAIALPEIRFTLLDANGKKARFCRHAVRTLKLDNVEVVEERAERYAPAAPFDAAIARAVGPLAQLRALAAPRCRGPVFAMKGRRPEDELAALGDDAGDIEITRLKVPGLDAERHLVILPPRPPPHRRAIG